MSRFFQTTTGVAVLLGLIGIFSLCLGSFSVIKMSEMGQMTDCALARTATLCPVSAASHLQLWQQIVVTTSPTTILLTLILAAVVFSFRNVIDPLSTAAMRLKYAAWQLLSEPTLLFGDYLKQAFSQGILHPKIY